VSAYVSDSPPTPARITPYSATSHAIAAIAPMPVAASPTSQREEPSSAGRMANVIAMPPTSTNQFTKCSASSVWSKWS